ncbi:MAG: ATP-binding protein [Bacteroidales bacterium]|nr:MAG: ATP-binding protein [Bacteroidales bacterium]
MIKRIISDDLLSALTYFPVVGIVGPRQVGKTTLAKELLSNLNKESVYLDLENPKDFAKLNDPVLFFSRNTNKCVVLDEIQRQPQLFPILRSMIDENRIASRFIILGSASPDLIRDSSESLAGRIAYQELAPFNLLEVQGKNDIYHHWIAGGFPNAFLAPSEFIRKKWLSNFIQTYIERDLPLLGLDINRNTIRRLWTMIAHIHGNILNMSSISRSLEVSSTTLKRYLSFLENAFLIRQLYPYSSNVKKRLVKSPKIYIRDSGILHHLLSISNFDSLESNPIIGASWEGFAIEQIAQRVESDIQCFYYRTHEGAECDLVLVKSGKPIAGIEIKYTSTPKPQKGMLQSFSDLGTEFNYIVTPSTDDFLLTNQIRACSLTTFLEKYISFHSSAIL